MAESGGDFQSAAQYLGFAPGSCWRWSDGGEVVEWVTGGTIAFRQEIEEVLVELASDGLPAFEAVVYLLDRCRKNRLPPAVAFERLFQRVPPFGMSEHLPALQEGLQRLDASLGDETAGLEDKRHLIGLLLASLPDECRLYTQARATTVVEAIALGMKASEFRLTDPRLHEQRLRLTVKALEGVVARFDADSLGLARRTGLDRLVQPAPLERAPFECIRDLLGQLEEDPEFRSLARLARDIMAATHIPRPLSAQHDLPVGGITDITNRGALDRLLLSELANDDLTLAVRVALNEALYLRRESPPPQPRGRRALLLDAGIRMWGVPRVFATAAALALGATSRRGEELIVYRARQGEIQSVDLTNREGLIQHLAALYPDPHPGSAMVRFLERARDAGACCDPVLVTHANTLEDPLFRRMLSLDMEPFYCATVDQDGGFRLLLRSRGTWKVIREARLDLESLLKPAAGKPDRQQLLLSSPASGLPAIFYANPFPLLLPARFNSKRACSHRDHGVVALTDDRRLMHWTNAKQGARQVALGFAPGHVEWIEVSDEGVVSVLLRHAGHLQLVNVDLANGGSSQVELGRKSESLKHVVLSGGVLLIFWNRSVCAYEVQTGRLLGTQAVARTQLGSRYVINGSRLHAIDWDGLGIRLAQLELPALTNEVALSAFDRRGFDGPFVITTRGRILSATTGECVKLQEDLGWIRGVLDITRDGDQLWLSCHQREPDTQRWQEQIVNVELASGRICRSTRGRLDPVLSRDDLYNRQLTPRRWHGVCVDTSGSVLLLGNQNTSWRIVRSPDATGTVSHLGLARVAHTAFKFNRFEKRPHGETPVAGVSLRVAQLGNGSRVYMDGRGLVHFKSGDSKVSEVTLATFDGVPLAGWSSDGHVCGTSFFLPDPSRSSSGAIWANLALFGQGAR